MLTFQRILSEFAPDSHSVIKPVRVAVTRVLHYVCNKFEVSSNGFLVLSKTTARDRQRNGTDCAVENNEGSHVIGEFVDGRGVQFWSCRRESSCHMARC